MNIHSTTHGIPRFADSISSDACHVETRHGSVIAVLADGAGSGDGAREAARRTVEEFASRYQSRPAASDPELVLEEIALLLNRTFCRESVERFGRREMVCTLAVAAVAGDILYGLSAGDSRMYLLRGQSLEQLSVDHTAPYDDNCLISGLGITEYPEWHSFERTIIPGDRVLLCSDGVWKNLPEAELCAALGSGASARDLVSSASAAAKPETRDDMTAVVLDVRKSSGLRSLLQRLLPQKS